MRDEDCDKAESAPDSHDDSDDGQHHHDGQPVGPDDDPPGLIAEEAPEDEAQSVLEAGEETPSTGPPDFRDHAIAAQWEEVLAYLYSPKAAAVAGKRWTVAKGDKIPAHQIQHLVSDALGKVTEGMLTMFSNRDKARRGPQVWDPDLEAYVNRAIRNAVIRLIRDADREEPLPPLGDEDEDDGGHRAGLESLADEIDIEAEALQRASLDCVRKYIDDAWRKGRVSRDDQVAAVVSSAALAVVNTVLDKDWPADMKLKELIDEFLEAAAPGRFHPHPEDDEQTKQNKEKDRSRYRERVKDLLEKAIGECGSDEGENQ
ncbi:MAG TPA: hypothetical protein VK988_22215 [Acidimicrobiales bacterium]|nr:hypothetical protein [Acidimicrobiales bacterium]